MVDRVKPLKLESPDTGGVEEDQFPTSMNPQEDFVECAGLVLDDASHVDETTAIWRDNTNMKFKDGANPSGFTLAELAASAGGGITEAQHDSLPQLIHFLDGGPGTGWVSGACEEVLPLGDPFPLQVIWWTSVAKTQKIVEVIATRNANKTVATETWKMYDGTGTLIKTLVDTFSYSGVMKTGCVRTWT